MSRETAIQHAQWLEFERADTDKRSHRTSPQGLDPGVASTAGSRGRPVSIAWREEARQAPFGGSTPAMGDLLETVCA
jgi:hypothetical protein